MRDFLKGVWECSGGIRWSMACGLAVATAGWFADQPWVGELWLLGWLVPLVLWIVYRVRRLRARKESS